MKNKNVEEIERASTYVLSKPPFVGRYYICRNKKLLFTHRHPSKQEYWCEEFGWVPTEELGDPI